jgi:microcin C transport system substrate-binding protein
VKAPQGGTLKMSAIGTFDTLNPFSIKGRSAQGLDLVYDRLMARVWDEPFTMYPLIAERVDVPEDRSSITVHVNPKARFHDASPITADDVIFSFETLKKQGRPNMRAVYRLVAEVNKIDDMTVQFKLGPAHDRETVMILAMMPVLSKTFWSGKTFDTTSLEVPMQNGPYKIAQVDPGRRIVYERVKDYWANDLLTARGHFNFDKVIYDYYRDDTVAFEAFKAGDLTLRRELDAGQWSSAYDFPAALDKRVKLDSRPARKALSAHAH